VVESALPDDAATQRFVSGLFDGLTAGALPVVAAERTNAAP
jgi:hypothetical protein